MTDTYGMFDYQRFGLSLQIEIKRYLELLISTDIHQLIMNQWIQLKKWLCLVHWDWNKSFKKCIDYQSVTLEMERELNLVIILRMKHSKVVYDIYPLLISYNRCNHGIVSSYY